MVALLAVPVSPAAADPGRPAIAEIRTELSDGVLTASFRLVDSLDAETLERIHSGIPVTFKHRLDLVGARRYWLGSRKLYGRVRVETRVEYDPLLKRYTLWRRVETGDHEGGQAPEERLTAEESRMRSFLTVVEALALTEPGTELPVGKLKLRIHSNLGRRYVMMIFPASVSISAERQFELDGTP